jgi:DNA-binding transcriptional ArsR family regulator
VSEDSEHVWPAHFERQRQRWLGQLEVVQRLLVELTGERTTGIEQGYRVGCTVRELADATGLSQSTVRATLGELLQNPLARERRRSR